jgi:hypothetical protein
MPGVFWFGCGIVGVGVLAGLVIGARSRSSSALSGAAMGLFLGVMAGFIFLAIGLATS